MANLEHVAILQHGVTYWNEWRKDKDGQSLDLSEADFSSRDLTGIDLRAVNLSKTVLRGTKFGPGSLLWNANLSGADLYGANLSGADLQEAKFNNADLFQANLREANLQGADLSTARGGLLSKQLAGSDLTAAKLPEPLAKLYDSLSSVKEISDSAQKLFLALLAGCLYSWLTIAQTTDVELITNRATTPLPIIQAAIPIVGFYVVAPLILLCLYFYFHFYLQKLWEELGSLPAVFTDGRELHKRTDPWLLNDLVRSHFVKLKDGRPFLSYFQAWVSVLLAWWLVPVTLFVFWLRFLHRHDLFWTIIHVCLLALAVFSAVRLYRIANETLRGKERTVFRWKDLLKRRSNYLRFGFLAVLGATFIAASLGVIYGESLWKARFSAPRTWMPWLLDQVGYYDAATLELADVSVKPVNWTGKREEELEQVKGASLDGRNLRHANAWGAFFAKANLSGADMQGAEFSGADFRQSKAWAADLRYSHLSSALLQSADMRSTALDQSNLNRANLQGSNLQYASMVGADLSNANLSAAKMQGSDLTGAIFDRTFIKYADFRKGGSLINLNTGTMQSGNVKGLTADKVRTGCIDWELAFFDPDMLQQLGLPADHNEKLQKQMDAEQQAKAAAATPPAPKAKP